MQLGAKEEEGAVRKGVRERVREGGREGGEEYVVVGSGRK